MQTPEDDPMTTPQAVSHMPQPVPIDAQRQLRQSVHVETLAECLYETAGLCDRLAENAPSWDRLAASEKARYRFTAIHALNSLEPSKRYEAMLRARQDVAHLPHYGGRDFHLLPGLVQRQIAATVSKALETYRGVLEGFYSPLWGREAVRLEPSEDES